MSPTFLQVTVGLIAAVLVFLFALRAVPLIIDQLSRYFDRVLDTDPNEEESHNYER
jgi:hypothetical protein